MTKETTDLNPTCAEFGHDFLDAHNNGAFKCVVCGLEGALIEVPELDSLRARLAALEAETQTLRQERDAAHKAVSELSQSAHLEWTRAERAEQERDEATDKLRAALLREKQEQGWRRAAQAAAQESETAAESAEAALAALTERATLQRLEEWAQPRGCDPYSDYDDGVEMARQEVRRILKGEAGS